MECAKQNQPNAALRVQANADINTVRWRGCYIGHIYFMGSPAEPVLTDMGLWRMLLQKRNATLLQRTIVTWSIAIYGVSFEKSLNVEDQL